MMNKEIMFSMIFSALINLFVCLFISFNILHFVLFIFYVCQINHHVNFYFVSSFSLCYFFGKLNFFLLNLKDSNHWLIVLLFTVSIILFSRQLYKNKSIIYNYYRYLFVFSIFRIYF